MKAFFFIMMLSAAGLFMTNRSQAQLHVNINIGNQPAWAPEGFDDAQFYYIPDMDVYYDVPMHQFVYMSNRRWVRTAVLPASYGRFDLYRVHKVPMNERDAYKNHDHDRQQYAQYRGKFDQHPIRDSHDEKYSRNKNNWKNNRYSDEGDRGRGNDHHDKGHDNGRH